jgi:hypothetical protein
VDFERYKSFLRNRGAASFVCVLESSKKVLHVTMICLQHLKEIAGSFLFLLHVPIFHIVVS